MATLSCILILVLGNLLGAVVRGITGFGSAILNLCVWVVFTCLGFDAGTLQQAVVAECVCSEFCALPLLRLTRAASTCDWRLTSSLFIFGSLGAPVGAALLTALPVRGVEFVMACVLLLVTGVHCHVLRHVQQWLQSRQQPLEQTKQCSYVSLECQQVSNSAAAVQGSSISTPEQQIATSQVLPAEQQRPAGHVATAALGAVEDGANPTFQLLQPLAETQQSIPGASTIEDTNAAQQADVAVPVNTELQIHQQCGAEPGRSKPGSSSSASADGFRLAHTSSERRNCSDSSDEETALLLSSGSNNSSSSSSTVQLSPATDVSACSSSWRGRWQAAKGWWAQANEPEQRRATLRLLMYGSLAGSVSGAMAGMTGMGGPPLMMLYEKLQINKDTVRGCNAVLSVLQFRVIAYAMTGIFTRADLWLYVAVSVAGLAGLCLGSHLASRMDQATFSKVMVVLMLLCCALLFASSAGLTGS